LVKGLTDEADGHAGDMASSSLSHSYST
jgi:hypothetical protein